MRFSFKWRGHPRKESRSHATYYKSTYSATFEHYVSIVEMSLDTEISTAILRNDDKEAFKLVKDYIDNNLSSLEFPYTSTFYSVKNLVSGEGK